LSDSGFREVATPVTFFILTVHVGWAERFFFLRSPTTRRQQHEGQSVNVITLMFLLGFAKRKSAQPNLREPNHNLLSPRITDYGLWIAEKLSCIEV